jgi:hypothetical protein
MFIVKKTYDDTDIGMDFTSHAWVRLMHPFNPWVVAECGN